ncbi:MAG: sigma-54-dependent Fis family transcriptional regulator, partial [FCB group bacterium]|nr:sigma-54-dependent Fis family transcriptional regulator [FCB group bacterium]
ESKIEIDIRLMAATNKNLKERVASGDFREDLFYRLNVIPIHIPPLRERKEDIPILVKGFINKFSPTTKIEVDKSLMELLINCRWPGNVRELENLIERMVILRNADLLTIEDLPHDFGEKEILKQTNESNFTQVDNFGLTDVEKKMIIEALNKSAGNKTKAAKMLKIPRHVLIYKIKKYDIIYNE